MPALMLRTQALMLRGLVLGVQLLAVVSRGLAHRGPVALGAEGPGDLRAVELQVGTPLAGRMGQWLAAMLAAVPLPCRL